MIPETVSDTCDSPLVQRLSVKFTADDRWVVTRPFFPGGEARVRSVCHRVSELSDEGVQVILRQVQAEFAARHKDMLSEWTDHFRQALQLVPELAQFTPSRQRLIGAYFTMEYAFASAALFNPSIVLHPDQSGVDEESLRFIMSLRATGEGHVSSIVFRTGTIGPRHHIQFDPPAAHQHRMRLSPDRRYEKALFRRKLCEVVVDESVMDLVMNRLPDSFTMVELEHAIEHIHAEYPDLYLLGETADNMTWLARENYQLSLDEDADISELVVFPQSDNDRMGIEDLRLVRFIDDDHSVRYFGTYSAYNGTHVLPQLMETCDFHHLKIHTLNGPVVQNKGMALFPRRVNGHYCMSSRIDGENLFLMFSNNIQFWETAEMLRAPRQPWEFMQIGNCGSPIETSEGWLLLTHGVGPMRKYCIGAMLLDRDDPLRVIGSLQEPLIAPNEQEREGYVPNVVYTCGALAHHHCLFIPYAMSDSVTGVAVVSLEKLLNELHP
ncbi:Beta-1,4-mannooligosaccharide phosphorylase [Novipirellula galeiformis]|uniref:Beta-1,4-mannooligosaccharide phosphorylase n=1 Tax=Novipirellula galeiformis TaxID=2528004 RepID=A0A5C6CIW9_9BACT|nr:glycoside hydrolase family 130 protein [Novipirellula galeiformis]TWU23384.1 Beta-1,4-mannooligosaccharide phosphorylase [Novipirellula galeiformis]